jgi:antitoxin (DNA-binding transcriptional repressor) of toxin-antitoxin stability system
VEQGQEVVITRSGVPIARLVVWQAQAQPVAAPGAMRGKCFLADDFDAPLDGFVWGVVVAERGSCWGK